MSATDYCLNPHPDVKPDHELLEVHRSKISLHHAKADYSYPTIRLPHKFTVLAGLPTRIYQTVCEGALAFLVVISPKEDASKSQNPPYSHADNHLLLLTDRATYKAISKESRY